MIKTWNIAKAWKPSVIFSQFQININYVLLLNWAMCSNFHKLKLQLPRKRYLVLKIDLLKIWPFGPGSSGSRVAMLLCIPKAVEILEGKGVKDLKLWWIARRSCGAYMYSFQKKKRKRKEKKKRLKYNTYQNSLSLKPLFWK